MKRIGLLASAMFLLCNLYPVAAADAVAATVKKQADTQIVKPIDLDKRQKDAQDQVVLKQKYAAQHVDPSLQMPPIAALDEAAFTIGGVGIGDAAGALEAKFGKADKVTRSEHFTNLRYDSDTLGLRVIMRNDTAEILKTPGFERKAIRIGMDSAFLSHGDAVVVGRGIHLGTPVEVMIRQYGVPANVLRDAEANVYYFVYASPDENSVLVFAVRERKVQRVALMPVRPPYYTTKKDMLSPGPLQPRDFTLMGFAMDETFVANRYNMWLNMIPRKDDKFWLYGNYGLQVDKHNQVKRVFLMVNNTYTPRGATLGYHISTVLALYGLPSRIEKGPAGKEYYDAYYYDSPYQSDTSLVFITKHDGDFVSDIILTSTPVVDLQNPLKRYDFE